MKDSERQMQLMLYDSMRDSSLLSILVNKQEVLRKRDEVGKATPQWNQFIQDSIEELELVQMVLAKRGLACQEASS